MVKADVQGSVEAVCDAIARLSSDKVLLVIFPHTCAAYCTRSAE